MKEKTQIALVQMRCGPEPDINLAHALELIGVAAKNGAQIVCLPELFRSQYFCQSENHDNFSLAESIPGPSTEALTKLAREKSIVIVASLFEKRAAGVYHNTAVVIDADGNILGKYRKMHIPDDPSYYEKFYPTAIGWHPSEKKEFGKAQHSAWETIQRSHAIANGCYIAVANRIGPEAPAGGDR